LMIGGGGEKVTLKIAARHADHWNVWGGPETLARKGAILDAHCRVAGRDPKSIARSANMALLISDDRAEADRLRTALTKRFGMAEALAKDTAVAGSVGEARGPRGQPLRDPDALLDHVAVTQDAESFGRLQHAGQRAFAVRAEQRDPVRLPRARLRGAGEARDGPDATRRLRDAHDRLPARLIDDRGVAAMPRPHRGRRLAGHDRVLHLEQVLPPRVAHHRSSISRASVSPSSVRSASAR